MRLVYARRHWRAAGLEEPNAARQPGGQHEAGGEAAAEAGAQVDNMEAGGFFARYGCERDEALARARARAFPPAAAAPSPAVPWTGDSDGSDDSDS